MQTFDLRKIVTASLLATPFLLTACGGDSSDNGSSSSNSVDASKPTNPKPTNPKPTNPKPTNPKPTNPKPTNPKPTNPKPTNPKPTNPKPTNPKPTNPKPTNPKPTNPKPTETLVDTNSLPTLPSNDQPLALNKNKAAIQTLADQGIYKVTSSTILGFGSGKYECDGKNTDALGKTIYCQIVTQYKYDSASKNIVSVNWIYEPTKQSWRKITLIRDDRNFYNPFFHDSYGLVSDGKKWLTTKLDLKNTPAVIDNGSLAYTIGDAKFLLTLPTTSLANNHSRGVTYSADAKKYVPQINLIKGEYLSLNKRGTWDKSDDGNVYKTLGEYRSKHISKESVLCFYPMDWSAGIVFDKNHSTATRYKLATGCGTTIKNDTTPVMLTEGVKTIADKKVIYLSNVPNNYRADNTSGNQFLYAVALNSEGVPAQGKAYQKGYAEQEFTHDPYLNRTAVLDRLKVENVSVAKKDLPF
ncbi:hypothetical protein [Psychrobacter pygoscelis]|uniref:hypothetical protein n=1 Tax=Psychrobacter pygoscelis TaxID=2488563 RepID=UPI001A9544CC|nr:hypothetical protein [Psychrobacter pygoscelis]